MVKIAALAAAAGALTGILVMGAWIGGQSPLHGSWATMTIVAAVVLILDSLVAYLGPKSAFYVSALLSALLVGSDWSGSTSETVVTSLVTTAAACVTIFLAIAAARYEPEVSEQSNPMNLPVFG